MIVSTINVNGIRAAIKERSAENLGLLPWFAATTADVVCLQETRADDDRLATALAPVLADGWQLASAESHVKGRSGVAILSRHPIDDARLMDSDEFGTHGRYLEVDTAGMTVASLYIHAGEADTPRQSEKERFMATLAARMAILAAAGRDAVMCGDWNIAHTENDIKNWKGNVKKSGFLPSERAWLTDLSPSQAGGAPTRPAGSTWCGRFILTSQARMPGGLGGAAHSTTTQACGSTISSPPHRSRREPCPPGSSGPRPMRCAGPTMPRSPSNIHLLWTVSGAHDR